MSFSNKVEMLLHHANTTELRALPLTPPAQLDSPPSTLDAATLVSTAGAEPGGEASASVNTYVAASTIKNDSFQVSITTQPPLKTVYQRILKPFPTVTLTVAPQQQVPTQQTKNQKSRRRSRGSPLSDDDGGDDVDGGNEHKNSSSTSSELEPGCADVLDTLMANSSNSSSNGLFVEATLLRGDNGEPISKCLDGNSIVRFEKNPWSEGVYTATFKKLKILSTSQQLQGILFRLKFTLKKYAGNNFTTITTPNCDVVSHPVEVFSHSQYLNKKAPKPSAASTNTRKEFKDIVKKMDGKKVQGALFSVLQAFKEQGGSRSSVLDVVQQVYGDDAGGDEGSKARGPSRRMSAPSSYNGPQISQPQLILTPSLPLVTATSVADANIAASAVEAQFLNELLSKFQLGAISFDDFVNHLAQGVGKARAIQLLAQMGLNVGLDATTTTTTASSSPSPLSFPTTILPSFPSNNPLDSSNSLAAILNALAHQQTQLAQLQAAQQSQQLSSINPFLQQHQQQQQQLQLQHQQYQQQKAQAQLHQQLATASSVPVVPKPRRLSSSQAAAMSPTSTSSPSASTSSGSSPLHSAGMALLPSISLPSSATVTPSSASSSLSTLADAISSHLYMQPQPQPQPQPQTTSTPSSTSSSSLLMHHMNSFSSTSSSNDSNSVVLPPIAATLAAVSSSSSSNSTGPLPSLFSLCSLASAIDSPATTASGAIDQDRGRKRSFEAAAAAPPSPNKIARRDGDVASSPSSSAARCEDSKQATTQWYWKNNSTWEPYAEGVSSQLERAHSNAKATPCIVVLHDVPYRMDFQSMTQQRIDNPKRWKHIRRGEEDEHSA